MGFSQLALKFEQLIGPNFFLLAVKVFLTKLLNRLRSFEELLAEQSHEQSGHISLNIVCQLNLRTELLLSAIEQENVANISHHRHSEVMAVWYLD